MSTKPDQVQRQQAKAATVTTLLAEAMRVQSLQEAWFADGPGWETLVLSRTSGLKEEEDRSKLRLIPVEVRAVLDEPRWCCSASDNFYDLPGPRRVWIVREMVGGLDQQQGDRHFRPALMSSMGLEELCAWIERVVIAYNSRTLRKRDLPVLWRPLLEFVSKDETLSFLNRYHRLTPSAFNTMPHVRNEAQKRDAYSSEKARAARSGIPSGEGR